jgi:hypothetical protein
MMKLSLKGENYQARKGRWERVTVLLRFNANSCKILFPSVVGEFKKPHCLKALPQKIF